MTPNEPDNFGNNPGAGKGADPGGGFGADPGGGFGQDPGGGRPPLPPDEVGEESITTGVKATPEDLLAVTEGVNLHGAQSMLAVEAGEHPASAGARRYTAPAQQSFGVDAAYDQYEGARKTLTELRNDPMRWARVSESNKAYVEAALAQPIPSREYFRYRAATLELTATTGISPHTGAVAPAAFGNPSFGDAAKAQAAAVRAQTAIDALRAAGPDPALTPAQQAIVDAALSKPMQPDFWWADQASWISGKEPPAMTPTPEEIAHAQGAIPQPELEFRESTTGVDLAGDGPDRTPTHEMIHDGRDVKELQLGEIEFPPDTATSPAVEEVKELQIAGLEIPGEEAPLAADNRPGEAAPAGEIGSEFHESTTIADVPAPGGDGFDPGGVTAEMPGARPGPDPFLEYPVPANPTEPGEPVAQPPKDPFKDVEKWTGNELGDKPFEHVDAWTGEETPAARPGAAADPAADYGIPSVDEVLHGPDVKELVPGEITFPPETAATEKPAAEAGGAAAEAPSAGPEAHGDPMVDHAQPAGEIGSEFHESTTIADVPAPGGDGFDPGGATAEMRGARPGPDPFLEYPVPANPAEPGEPVAQPPKDPFKDVEKWTGNELGDKPFEHVDAWTGEETPTARPGAAADPAADYGIPSVDEVLHGPDVKELVPGEITFPPETAATEKPAAEAGGAAAEAPSPHGDPMVDHAQPAGEPHADPMADYAQPAEEPRTGPAGVESAPGTESHSGVDLEGSVHEEAAPTFDRANSLDAINYEFGRKTLAVEMGTGDVVADVNARQGGGVGSAAYEQMWDAKQNLLDRLGTDGPLDAAVDPKDHALVEQIRTTDLAPKEFVDLKIANLDLAAATGVDPQSGKAYPELRDNPKFGDEALIRDASARQSAALEALDAKSGAGLSGPDRTYWAQQLSQQPMNGDKWVAVTNNPPADLIPFTPGGEAASADRITKINNDFARDTLFQLDTTAKEVAGGQVIDITYGDDGLMVRHDYASFEEAPPAYRENAAQQYGEAVRDLSQMGENFWKSLDPVVAEQLKAHIADPVFEPPPPSEAKFEMPVADHGPPAVEGETPPTAGHEPGADAAGKAETLSESEVKAGNAETLSESGAESAADAAAIAETATASEAAAKGELGAGESPSVSSEATGVHDQVGGEATGIHEPPVAEPAPSEPASVGGEATGVHEPPAPSGDGTGVHEPPSVGGEATGIHEQPGVGSEATGVHQVPPSTSPPSATETGSVSPPPTTVTETGKGTPPPTTVTDTTKGTAPPPTITEPGKGTGGPTATDIGMAAGAAATTGVDSTKAAPPASPAQPGTAPPTSGGAEPATAPGAPPGGDGTAGHPPGSPATGEAAGSPPPTAGGEAPSAPAGAAPGAHPGAQATHPSEGAGGAPSPPDVAVPDRPAPPPVDTPKAPETKQAVAPAAKDPPAPTPVDEGVKAGEGAQKAPGVGEPQAGIGKEGGGPVPGGTEPGAGVEGGKAPAGPAEPGAPKAGSAGGSTTGGVDGSPKPKTPVEPQGGTNAEPEGQKTEPQSGAPEPEGGMSVESEGGSKGGSMLGGDEPQSGSPPEPDAGHAETPPMTKESVMADAKTQLEAAGYKDVAIFPKEDGGYRLTATGPDGKPISVRLSPEEPWIKNPPSEWPPGAAGYFQGAMTGLMVWDAVDNVLANADPETAFHLMDLYADACKAIGDFHKTGDPGQVAPEMQNLLKGLEGLAGPLAGLDAGTATLMLLANQMALISTMGMKQNPTWKNVTFWMQLYVKIKHYVQVERGKYYRLTGIIADDTEHLIGEDLTGFELFPGFTHARNVYKWIRKKVASGEIKKGTTGKGGKAAKQAYEDGTRPVKKKKPPEETPEQKKKKQADALIKQAAGDVHTINWCDEQIQAEQKKIGASLTKYGTNTLDWKALDKEIRDSQDYIDRLKGYRANAERDLEKTKKEATATGVQLGNTGTNFPDAEAAQDYQRIVDMDVEIEKQRDKTATLLGPAQNAKPPYDQQPEVQEYLREGNKLLAMEQERKKIATGLEKKGVKVPAKKYPDQAPGWVPDPNYHPEGPKKISTGGDGAGAGAGGTATGGDGKKPAPGGGGGGAPTPVPVPDPPPAPPDPPPVPPTGKGGTGTGKKVAGTVATVCAIGFGVGAVFGPSGGSSGAGGQPTDAVTATQVVAEPVHVTADPNAAQPPVLTAINTKPIGDGGTTFYEAVGTGQVTSFTWGVVVDPQCGTLQDSHDSGELWDHHPCDSTQEANAVILTCAQGPGGVAVASIPALAQGNQGFKSKSGTGNCGDLIASHNTNPLPVPTPGMVAGPVLADVPSQVSVTNTTTPPANGSSNLPLAGGGALLVASAAAVVVRRRRKMPPYPCGALDAAAEKAWDELMKMGDQLSDAHRRLDQAEQDLKNSQAYCTSLQNYVNAMQQYCQMLQGYLEEMQKTVEQLSKALDAAIESLGMHGVPANKLSHQHKDGWIKVATGLYAEDQHTAKMAGAAVDPNSAWADMMSATFDLDMAEGQLESADQELTDATIKLDWAEGDLTKALGDLQTRIRAFGQAKGDYANAQRNYQDAKAAFEAARDADGACHTKYAADVKAAMAGGE